MNHCFFTNFLFVFFRNKDFHPKFNQLDGNVDRRSFAGVYTIDALGYPLNPTGRTGIKYRGILGKWGPNHAADPIVTRWKHATNSKEKIFHEVSKKPILQFVAIQRRDTKEWAIPGVNFLIFFSVYCIINLSFF